MNAIPPKGFFDWFDQILKERGLSDRQIAGLAGISQSVLSKARNDVQGIGWDAAAALAQALDVPPIVMFQRLGLLELSKQNPSPLQDEMNSIFANLSDEDKDELLQMGRIKWERKKQRIGKKSN